MARNCCDKGGGCSCIVQGGTGITVEGSGTSENPFVVSSDLAELGGLLQVRDTTTVNLTLLGGGSVDSPFVLQANASLRMTDLVDVQDPSGGPSVGETPIWTGAGVDGHWEFGTLPPAPAGAVNTTVGLSGTGTVPDPIRVDVAATWGAGELIGLGSDSTIGLPVYEDSAGKLRAKPVTAAAITWNDIRNKPSSFTPSVHTHNAADISATQQLLLDVGKIRGRRIFVTSTATAPTGFSGLDLWFYPKGA